MNIFNCSNLIAMGRHIPTPFSLSVFDNAATEMLKVDTILRIVPGKRIVARCTWKNQTVVAKIFFRRGHWKQSMLRDLQGVTLLRQAGIPTPRVIIQTTTADKNGAVLLIDFLKQSTSLLALFEAATSDEERATIMEMGVGMIARCHQAGLWQRDIHLGNFMLSQGKIYVLDGGDIKGEGKPLDRKTCLQNLAMFFAQFPIALDAGIAPLLGHYLKTADTLNAATTTEALTRELQDAVIAARKQRLHTYSRKLFRSTTAHRLVHTHNRMAIYDRVLHSSELEEIIEDPDRLLVNARMLKEGNSSTVAVVLFDGREFVLKRYNVKGFLHGLKRLFQPSRAHHSWRNAAILEMLGIATPHAVLMVEERALWLFRRRAWILSEYIDAENLLVQLENDKDGTFPFASVVARFEVLLQSFQTYHISHGDMKASNFVIKDDRLYVLDLDAMKQHRSTEAARTLVMKDHERFSRNWTGTVFESAIQQMSREAG